MIPHSRRDAGCWLALAVALCSGLAAAADWSNYDWSQEELELSEPGETTAQAIQTARQAVAGSPMRMTLNTVGFDIPAGSTAEDYLQRVAQAAGGGYYRAEATGDLSAAMSQAATGRPAPTAPTSGELVVCRGLDNGQPQGAADHFASLGEVWVHARYTNLPEGTKALCIWLHGEREVTRSERVIGGNGWVAFSVRTSAPQGFSPGVYTVRIMANDRLFGQRQFTIGQP